MINVLKRIMKINWGTIPEKDSGSEEHRTLFPGLVTTYQILMKGTIAKLDNFSGDSGVVKYIWSEI